MVLSEITCAHSLRCTNHSWAVCSKENPTQDPPLRIPTGTLNIALLVEVGGWYHPRSPIRGERKGKVSGADAAGSNNKLMNTQQYGLILKHSFESRVGNQMTIIASYPICQLHGFKFYKTQQCGAYSGEGPGREDGK